MSKSCSKWHTVDHSSSHSSRWWLKRCAERFQCQATIVLHWCKNKTELTTITWVSRMRKIPGQMLTSPFWGSEPWVISHTTCTNKNKRYYCIFRVCVCVHINYMVESRLMFTRYRPVYIYIYTCNVSACTQINCHKPAYSFVVTAMHAYMRTKHWS